MFLLNEMAAESDPTIILLLLSDQLRASAGDISEGRSGGDGGSDFATGIEGALDSWFQFVAEPTLLIGISVKTVRDITHGQIW